MAGIKGRVRHFPNGQRVKVHYGDRITEGVVTGKRGGLVAVDLAFRELDEPVHAMFRESEIQSP